MADHDHTVHISVQDDSRVGTSVEVEYLGLDKPRLDAIMRSASDLIAAMFDTSLSAPHCDCVWPLINAVWPARSTNAYPRFPQRPDNVDPRTTESHRANGGKERQLGADRLFSRQPEQRDATFTPRRRQDCSHFHWQAKG